MADDEKDHINIRVPIGLILFMEKDIEENQEHRNKSEYIIAAMRFYEEHRTELLRKRNITEEDFIASSGSLQSDQDIKTK